MNHKITCLTFTLPIPKNNIMGNLCHRAWSALGAAGYGKYAYATMSFGYGPDGKSTSLVFNPDLWVETDPITGTVIVYARGIRNSGPESKYAVTSGPISTFNDIIGHVHDEVAVMARIVREMWERDAAPQVNTETRLTDVQAQMDAKVAYLLPHLLP
jgi:hypothetical protein